MENIHLLTHTAHRTQHTAHSTQHTYNICVSFINNGLKQLTCRRHLEILVLVGGGFSGTLGILFQTRPCICGVKASCLFYMYKFNPLSLVLSRKCVVCHREKSFNRATPYAFLNYIWNVNLDVLGVWVVSLQQALARTRLRCSEKRCMWHSPLDTGSPACWHGYQALATCWFKSALPPSWRDVMWGAIKNI